MPASNDTASGNEQTSNENDGKRTLSPEQARELARKLYAMLRRDLEIEQNRTGK